MENDEYEPSSEEEESEEETINEKVTKTKRLRGQKQSTKSSVKKAKKGMFC